ncbi:putative membrane protein YhfC [Oceanobacillus polygoni]|uniref:Membrane protein YhfC n=1 Tax=Oceanobacillus polygoni TaxID=1235259 RepID=A0A9X1CGC6_9BACI|nr:putative membrane protein YhfC [Oceanobacillus polygoni]
MRTGIALLILLITTMFFYRSRYKIMNALLRIGFFRKKAVVLSMKIPSLRSKMLQDVFSVPNM